MILKTLFIVLSMLISLPVLAQETAAYTVPTPAELKAFNTFTLTETSVTIQGKNIHIWYKLPLEIVDSQLHQEAMEFVGTLMPYPEHFTVKGVNAADLGTCFVNRSGLTCLLTYSFHTDLYKIEDYLRAKHPKEFDLRAQVARLFNHEAGGLLHIPGDFAQKVPF